MSSEMKMPRIINFGYRSYKITPENKCEAVCDVSTCRATIVETLGTTSGFIRLIFLLIDKYIIYIYIIEKPIAYMNIKGLPEK